jgi:hypothetical protein
MRKSIYILLVILTNTFCFGQNLIDPPNYFLQDTTLIRYKNTMIGHYPGFLRGWNWGTDGKALDEAMYINTYQGYYPLSTDYNDGMFVVQPFGLSGRTDDCALNGNSYIFNPCIAIDSTPNFKPTANNKHGSVFGFKYKHSAGYIANEAYNISPVYGASLFVILKDIWTTKPIHLF